jgi:hypothetical protein
MYDLITGKIFKELPTIGIQYLTKLFNAVLLQGYFPEQWKVTQIILIPRPGNPPPKNLLPIILKVLENLLLKKKKGTNQWWKKSVNTKSSI